ncbi:MAG TPA: hypothetical protein DD379_16255 [Cyanobacteria bacterium UBA11162]|nr:hypothetical protein [Cyanobacteria bacterium UBA11162]
MVGFFKNLGGKKSEGDSSTAPATKKTKEYFLELDESGNVKSETETKKPEPAKAEVAAAESSNGKAEAQAQPQEPAKATTPVEAPKPIPAPTPVAAASNGRVEPEPGLTFAPNNLLPLKSNNSRRRPGPSMNSFLEMASQMKTPGK